MPEITELQKMPDSKIPRRQGKLMASVYPEEWVHGIVGWGSTEWNLAIEIAAAILAVSAEENCDAFTPEEWNTIGQRFCNLNRGRRSEAIIPASHTDPAAFLATWMSDKPLLAEKLAKLDYTHAWAVVRASAWRAILATKIARSDEWWRPDFWKTKLLELYELVE